MPLLSFAASARSPGSGGERSRRPRPSPSRRRARLRRGLAAVLAGASVAGAGSLALDRPTPGSVPVVVASVQVGAGTPLTPDLLEVRHLADDAVPQAAVRELSAAVGRPAASVLAAGEVLTVHDVATGTLLVGHGPRARAVFVPVPEPSVLDAVAAGDRVDVHSPVDGSVVVPDALVLAVRPGAGTLGGADGGLWLAVADVGAKALAAARGADPAGGALLVALRPPVRAGTAAPP